VCAVDISNKKWFFRKHVFAILQLGCFDRDVILLRGVFFNETAQLPSAETYLYLKYEIRAR